MSNCEAALYICSCGNRSCDWSLLGLIALLRSAGIPARYVYGTVDIPVAQVQNWVGNLRLCVCHIACHHSGCHFLSSFNVQLGGLGRECWMLLDRDYLGFYCGSYYGGNVGCGRKFESGNSS